MSNLFMKRTLLFFIILLLFGCEKRIKRAGGGMKEIIVCADIEIWEETGNLLKEIFEKKLITPQNEKVFNLIKSIQ